mgnify:CR=1 FL=1
MCLVVISFRTFNKKYFSKFLLKVYVVIYNVDSYQNKFYLKRIFFFLSLTLIIKQEQNLLK